MNLNVSLISPAVLILPGICNKHAAVVNRPMKR